VAFGSNFPERSLIQEIELAQVVIFSFFGPNRNVPTTRKAQTERKE
jgi:hypothetical protein